MSSEIRADIIAEMKKYLHTLHTFWNTQIHDTYVAIIAAATADVAVDISEQNECKCNSIISVA